MSVLCSFAAPPPLWGVLLTNRVMSSSPSRDDSADFGYTYMHRLLSI